MKKTFFTIIMALLFQLPTLAQFPVTQFLGIPVDGSKDRMIQNLIGKGFKYSPTLDMLSGEFNGTDVQACIQTNKNKVCRIMLYNPVGRTESHIKNRFNTLVSQFKNNEKYLDVDTLDNYYISDDVDINYEVNVKGKQISATFYQKDNFYKSGDDFPIIRDIANKYLGNKYTEEEINTSPEALAEIITTAAELITNATFQRVVWFTIESLHGQFYIYLYYDNENNRAHGEDL